MTAAPSEPDAPKEAGPNASADWAVELCEIEKSYAGRRILQKVSLAVRRGEFFALLGPSGSGKSTLLKMVSGIDSPDSGTVRLRGRDVTHVPPFRRPVHTVFQNYALFPHLDVAGNVRFPLRVGRVQKSRWDERVRYALESVQMSAHARRRVTDPSGGERQRVALARALVNEPECVLLDEPLSALDPHLRLQTIQLLEDIQRRLGATYLYVTHDRDEALRAADRVGVMREGRLVQVGTPLEIYQRPASPFVAGFVGPINWLPGKLERDRGRPSLRLPDGTEISCGDAVLNDLTLAGTVRLGVRPENVRLEAEGFLAARVVQRQFSGATISVRLELACGVQLQAELPANAALPAAGDAVRVGWSESSLFVFPGDDELPPSAR